MTDLIELLKKPKQWVALCQQHLTELGYTDPYDYDRFINEELGELVGNLKSGKTPANRALLVDDIVDSMWVLLARTRTVSLPLEKTSENIKIRNWLGIFNQMSTDSTRAGLLIDLALLNNIDWQAAFSALVAENYSKLDFPIERRAEIFRTGKIQKRDLDGSYYPWFKSADFSVF